MDKNERLEKGILKLGELSEEAGIPLSTLRHYANLGLLISDERTQGNFRLFDRANTLERLKQIKKLIIHGLSLEQIQKEMNLTPVIKKEVLIVDDEKEVGEVIQELLKDRPVVSRIVYDGFAAGQALGENIPDLIILDINIPGINGFDICSQVKKQDKFKRTKILAITGYDTLENAQKMISYGADAYLAKPFDVPELLQKIDTLLGIP